jgi:uncharacterized protein YbjT (DUF2867 family)
MRTLVIGGTGTVGRELVKRLIAMEEDVFIMTRDAEPHHPAGARLIRGDLDDAASVRTAARGMDRMFLLVAQGPWETEQGLAAVAAARAEELSRLVYMSVRMPTFATDVPHFATKQVIERAVRCSEIPYTILRPNNFFQNDLAFLDVITQYGVYPQPIGSKGIARVDVRDIADVSAVTLVVGGHDGETYELNGPELLTGVSVAEAYARWLGRPVSYAGDSLEAWEASISQALPSWLVSDLKVMYEKFQLYGMPSTQRDDERLRELLGRPPRQFDAFVAEVTEAVSPSDRAQRRGAVRGDAAHVRTAGSASIHSSRDQRSAAAAAVESPAILRRSPDR